MTDTEKSKSKKPGFVTESFYKERRIKITQLSARPLFRKRKDDCNISEVANNDSILNNDDEVKTPELINNLLPNEASPPCNNDPSPEISNDIKDMNHDCTNDSISNNSNDIKGSLSGNDSFSNESTETIKCQDANSSSFSAESSEIKISHDGSSNESNDNKISVPLVETYSSESGNEYKIPALTATNALYNGNNESKICGSTGSDSFWDPGNYKYTTKRIEDSYKLCAELLNFVQERATIEKIYAKSLSQWSKKWSDIIEKGTEYGTLKTAWSTILTEADKVSDIHMKIKDNLNTNVEQKIRNYQKENYHYMILNLKERKAIEDEFRNCQKEWTKLLIDVEKAKINYHVACKIEHAALTDFEIHPFYLSSNVFKKAQSRLHKTVSEVSTSRDKYLLALDNLNKYKTIYVEEMSNIYSRCQSTELIRMEFFKSILHSTFNYIKTLPNDGLEKVYNNLQQNLDNINHEEDLNWWSLNYGNLMKINVPTFIEYHDKKHVGDISTRASRASMVNNVVDMALSTFTGNKQTISMSKFKKLLPFKGSSESEESDEIQALRENFSKSKKVIVIEF